MILKYGKRLGGLRICQTRVLMRGLLFTRQAVRTLGSLGLSS